MKTKEMLDILESYSVELIQKKCAEEKVQNTIVTSLLTTNLVNPWSSFLPLMILLKVRNKTFLELKYCIPNETKQRDCFSYNNNSDTLPRGEACECINLKENKKMSLTKAGWSCYY